MYYFASEAAIPIRSAAAESSEMVSQLLFGDIVIGKEVQENWLFIQHIEDGYEGWVTIYMLTPISQAEYENLQDWEYVHDANTILKLQDGTEMRLPIGAKIPIFELTKSLRLGKFKNKDSFTLSGKTWHILGGEIKPILPPHLLLATAYKFLNIPYLWGGRGGFGIDCSGFTQSVFRLHGIALLRDASQQAKQGETISWENKQIGDLVFFAKKGKTNVSHVGIYIGDEKIIHSSGKVRVDKLNLNGLYSYESQNVTHTLLTIKRFFSWELQQEPKS